MQLYYINAQCEVEGDENEAKVKQWSLITGKPNTMTVKANAAEVATWLMAKYRGINRPMVQDAFPQLSDEEREFLLTGITPEEWQDHVTSDEEPNE